VHQGFVQQQRAANNKLAVCMALQTEKNLTVSNSHKSRDYMQGLLAKAEYVERMNNLPVSIK
jgi:hypothetical protein